MRNFSRLLAYPRICILYQLLFLKISFTDSLINTFSGSNADPGLIGGGF